MSFDTLTNTVGLTKFPPLQFNRKVYMASPMSRLAQLRRPRGTRKSGATCASLSAVQERDSQSHRNRLAEVRIIEEDVRRFPAQEPRCQAVMRELKFPS
jgi:hypothetical protein